MAQDREPSSREVDAVVKLPPEARLKYFVKHVVDRREVFSLRQRGANGGGWVLSEIDHEQLVPVWPHAVYAELCAVAEWHDAVPASISLLHWIQKWAPGIAREGRAVAVFPVANGRHVRVPASELATALMTELGEAYGESLEDLLADQGDS